MTVDISSTAITTLSTYCLVKPSQIISANYLAGLVEGDGSIKVPSVERSPKGKLLYPSVTITFVKKDLPLASLLAKLLNGRVNNTPGQYVVLSIQNLAGIYAFAVLVNGKFRTPKIEALHRLIEWLNKSSKFPPIKALGLDTSHLKDNAWLTGLLEADSNFLITYLLNSSRLAYNVRLTMRLSQKQEYIRNSELIGSYKSIMKDIASFCGVGLSSYTRNRTRILQESGFLVRVTSKLSRELLISYINKYPLLSSKRLDYLDWLEAHQLVNNQMYKDLEGTHKLEQLKQGMNSNRTVFNWTHLDKIEKVL